MVSIRLEEALAHLFVAQPGTTKASASEVDEFCREVSIKLLKSGKYKKSDILMESALNAEDITDLLCCYPEFFGSYKQDGMVILSKRTWITQEDLKEEILDYQDEDVLEASLAVVEERYPSAKEKE